MKILFIIFIIMFISFITRTHAASEFSSSHDFTYEVLENGLTKVTQEIGLTNLTTGYYASDYSITFGTEKITEINARDNSGPLKLEVTYPNGTTVIHVFFNEKVLGIDKTLKWQLTYNSSAIARKMGRIWEINIPRAGLKDQSSSYNVKLLLPLSFGRPSYVWPKPSSDFFWTDENQAKNGISLAFGDWQGFSFDLTYNLNNSSFLPKQISIALPMETNYQKIILQKINPQPQEIKKDGDGNQLASYFLLPKQVLKIKVKGLAKIYASPQKELTDNLSSDLKKYLTPQKYWEVDDFKIKDISRNLVNPKAIYDYVTSTLNYDYQRAKSETAVRFGAKEALSRPNQALCTEFTDLYISLARAAGIPAREVDGYAYTPDSRSRPLSPITNVLHAWPEYWDENTKTWIQVDPTWGKTSQTDYFDHFDFNHLALSKRGLNSTILFGPENVSVTFIDNFPEKAANDVFTKPQSPWYSIFSKIWKTHLGKP